MTSNYYLAFGAVLTKNPKYLEKLISFEVNSGTVISTAFIETTAVETSPPDDGTLFHCVVEETPVPLLMSNKVSFSDIKLVEI